MFLSIPCDCDPFLGKGSFSPPPSFRPPETRCLLFYAPWSSRFPEIFRGIDEDLFFSQDLFPTSTILSSSTTNFFLFLGFSPFLPRFRFGTLFTAMNPRYRWSCLASDGRISGLLFTSFQPFSSPQEISYLLPFACLLK